MKKVYQYNEIIEIHRVFELVKKLMTRIDDDQFRNSIRYKTSKKYLMRMISRLSKDLEIDDLIEVIRKLKLEKRKESGQYGTGIYLSCTEIYEASRENREKKKRIRESTKQLMHTMLESESMNESGI